MFFLNSVELLQHKWINSISTSLLCNQAATPNSPATCPLSTLGIISWEVGQMVSPPRVPFGDLVRATVISNMNRIIINRNVLYNVYY